MKKYAQYKISKMDKYYIENDEDYVNIIENKIIRNLLLNKINKGDNTNWVIVELTDIIKRVYLKDRLKKRDSSLCVF